jgi:uncharacterized surface protein with fasciclin (FAS1) repeats
MITKRISIVLQLVGFCFIGLLTSCQQNSLFTPSFSSDELVQNAPQPEANKLPGIKKTIVENAIADPNLSALVAAVVKTGLVGALSGGDPQLTVFAPNNQAFSALPAPFNNAANISAITDANQIQFLKNVLLYHVIGSKVLKGQIANGRSSALTLKPGIPGSSTIYFSNRVGILRINGNALLNGFDLLCSNGVIHKITGVLLPPTQNIAEIAIGNPNFSILVAALVKTNLAGVFAGTGDFTVWAPTNSAFAQLPAPFNSVAGINGISDPATIAALSNILRYHVTGSRWFAWDFGSNTIIATLADGTKNTIRTSSGNPFGFARGNANPLSSKIAIGNILATNGTIQAIDRVLLP